MDVTENSITGWELNRHEVQVQLMPKVLKFLGYYPCNENTLGEKLKAWRMRNGVSIKQLIKLINMDGNTLKKMENGNSKVLHQSQDKVRLFLKLYYPKYNNMFDF